MAGRRRAGKPQSTNGRELKQRVWFPCSRFIRTISIPLIFSSFCLDTIKLVWTLRRTEPASSIGPFAGRTPSERVLYNGHLAPRRPYPAHVVRGTSKRGWKAGPVPLLRLRVKGLAARKYLKSCGCKLPVITALGAYVVCCQSNSIFPSWTSWVRAPSPAPFSTSYRHSKKLHSFALH